MAASPYSSHDLTLPYGSPSKTPGFTDQTTQLYTDLGGLGDDVDDWFSINRSLRDSGFSSIPFTTADNEHLEQMPSEHMLRATFGRVLAQFARRGRLVQDLVNVASQAKSENERLTRALESAQRHMDELATNLARAEERLRMTEETQLLSSKAQTDESRKLERQNANLRAKLTAAEHTSKQRELDLQHLRQHLSEVVSKDDRRAERQRDIFRQLQHREPRIRANGDVKLLEVVGAYESQRAAMIQEIDTLRKETRSLQEELNVYETPVKGSRQQERVDTLELQDTADELRRLLDEAALKVQRYEAQCREATARSARLEADNEELRRTHTSQSARIVALESALTRQAVARSPGSFDPDDSRHRNVVSTREAIKRDRTVHKLGLQRVASVPQDVLVKHIQDACVLMGVDDVWDLVPTLTKVATVVAAVPHLEAFVSTVCRITGVTPDSVPDVLRMWKEQAARAV
eukprot:TRINITY_DN11500_c0_g1_i1.p1 TRINITY_DN11500_c0_g1~~TRINITY_DN11500_c0_g1_i1.p1  ORF type:complete len:462 (-),score=108.59 TRINITY_DN11500_c0_g1_i1:191-1576(-)